MNRARGLAGLSRRGFLAWSAAVGASGLVGCKHTSAPVQSRSQIGEDAADADAVVTVGSKTTVSHTEPLLVSGVGLVWQLPGTGSSPPAGGWRTMLEESLKKMKRDQAFNIREVLDSPERTTSLVLVSALVPPGARKGDWVDVQITLPDESRTTSLSGGLLAPCELVTTETTGNIHSLFQNGAPAAPSGRLLIGGTWARTGKRRPDGTRESVPLVACSFVVVNGKPAPAALGPDGRPECRAGMIFAGAEVTGHRPYVLLLNDGDRRATVAAAVAERLNTTFHPTANPDFKVAEAKDNVSILVNVPTAYRHNHYRFLLVARQVPLAVVRADSAYRQKLGEELMDPATALTAALKLEALGGDCRLTLMTGLESPSPWVRFASAEALAYMGHTEGVGALARIAEDHPALRVPCLKALASVDDANATDRLAEMLASSDAELRQGAFVALCLADDQHAAVKGVLMSRSYWLHCVAAADAPAAVHLMSSGRTQVAIFGDVKVGGPLPRTGIGTAFSLEVPAGGLPVVRHVRSGHDGAEVDEVPCKTADLKAVLHALDHLGGGYAEAVELIRKADRAGVLTGPMVLDAVPRELSVQALSGFASVDPTLAKADVEVVRAGAVQPAVDANGFDLPAAPAAPAVTPAGALLAKPPLNRDPGRLFGPKRAADAPVLDPAVVPAGGE